MNDYSSTSSGDNSKISSGISGQGSTITEFLINGQMIVNKEKEIQYQRIRNKKELWEFFWTKR